MSEVVLVKGMAQLLLENEGRNGRSKIDLANETGAMVCSLQPSPFSWLWGKTRALRVGEVVVCLNEMEPGCTAVLPNGKSALNAEAVLWGV